MLGSIPHQIFCFYHLPTRGRGGIKLGDAWYVSNVSIFFIVPCYYIICFVCLMGFIIHFYIIFGTNLLTGGPVQIAIFLPISVFPRKGISNGIQTEWNLRKDLFWKKTQSERLGVDVKEATRRLQGREACPHPRGPHRAPLTYFFHLYILLYPENIQGIHETTFPPMQPSVPVISHLGTFSVILSKGDFLTEGFYINTIASPMMCE